MGSQAVPNSLVRQYIYIYIKEEEVRTKETGRIVFQTSVCTLLLRDKSEQMPTTVRRPKFSCGEKNAFGLYIVTIALA